MPWAELDAELEHWRAEGRCATMWVRDDDAETATDALHRLLDICTGASVPLGLAVIPAGADEKLAEVVVTTERVHVLQHGWAHENHASPDEKKAELGDHRSLQTIYDELERGRDRLATLFGERFLSVMVPPWNRIGTKTAASLAAHGYFGLSTFAPRNRSVAAPGTVRVNTHVDVFDWRGRRAYRGDDNVIDQAIAHLRARRLGEVDDDEPTGLITHHLIHDEGCWGFLERFLERYREHPAVEWPGVPEIFSPP